MPEIRAADDVRQILRAERKRRRLSQSQAAGLIGHTQKWLSDFERGKVDPPLSMVLKLLLLLNVRLDATPEMVEVVEGATELELDPDEGL